MNLRQIARTVSAFVTILLLSASAHAQLFRAYLAQSGNDANPCTLPQPCRLLPAALSAVASGGEIWMLDSANYNTATVNINKSVTILAVPGVVGSVVATAGDAIDIGTAGVSVTLRNLVIIPLSGTAVNGIGIQVAASLVVDNCLVADLPNNGIFAVDAARVRIFGSTIRGNGGTGVWVQGSTASSITKADIAESTLDANVNQGLVVISTNATAVVKASLRDSRVVQTTTSAGAVAESDVGGAVTLAVSNNVISNNFLEGIAVFGSGAKVWASGNTVSGNAIGLFNAGTGGVFESAGNNAVRNNTTESGGTISAVGTM